MPPVDEGCRKWATGTTIEGGRRRIRQRDIGRVTDAANDRRGRQRRRLSTVVRVSLPLLRLRRIQNSQEARKHVYPTIPSFVKPISSSSACPIWCLPITQQFSLAHVKSVTIRAAAF